MVALQHNDEGDDCAFGVEQVPVVDNVIRGVFVGFFGCDHEHSVSVHHCGLGA